MVNKKSDDNSNNSNEGEESRSSRKTLSKASGIYYFFYDSNEIFLYQGRHFPFTLPRNLI